MKPKAKAPQDCVPISYVERSQRTLAHSHPSLIGYLFWLVGFSGLHRFYFGKPLTGTVWFFSGGLLLVGWIVDLFLERLWWIFGFFMDVIDVVIDV